MNPLTVGMAWTDRNQWTVGIALLVLFLIASAI